MSDMLQRKLAELEKIEHKEKKKVYKAGGVTNTGAIYESVFYKDKPYFLVYLPTLKHFELKEELEGSEETILPRKKGMFPYKPYVITDELLNELNREPQNPKKLYFDVLQEFDDFLDMEMKWKHLLTTEVFETYTQHKLEELSYLFCLGAGESGKSRILKLLLALGYRPLKASSLPVADVYRYLGAQGEARGTILHDQAEFLQRNHELMPVYLDGYTRGTSAPRIDVKDGAGRKEQNFYETFSSKCFAGRWLPKDNLGFTERCIVIPCIKGRPRQKRIKKEDWTRWNTVKIKLLAWRMQTYSEDLVLPDMNLEGRMDELWAGKVAIANSILGNSNPVLEMARDMYEKAQRDERECFEAQLCTAILMLWKEKGQLAILLDDIWEELVPLVEGKAVEGNDYTIDSSLYGFVTKKTVGRKLREVFGADKSRLFGKGYQYVFGKDSLLKLARRYNLKEDLWRQETLA